MEEMFALMFDTINISNLGLVRHNKASPRICNLIDLKIDCLSGRKSGYSEGTNQIRDNKIRKFVFSLTLVIGPFTVYYTYHTAATN